MIFESDRLLFNEAKERGIPNPQEIEREDLGILMKFLKKYDFYVERIERSAEVQAGAQKSGLRLDYVDLPLTDKNLKQLREIGVRLGLKGEPRSKKELLEEIERLADEKSDE